MLSYEQYLLTCLSEECDEVSQRALKAIRFGMSEVQEGQPLNNSGRLLGEVADLLAILELLQDNGSLLDIQLGDAIDAKKNKFAQYAEYSRKLGILEPCDLRIAKAKS